MTDRPVDAITFDFWNTLMTEERGLMRGRRLEAWAGVLEDSGFSVERERLGAAFDSSWERFLKSWGANEQYGATQAAEHVLEELGFDVPEDVKDVLLESFTATGAQVDLHLTPNVADTLRALKDGGLRIGIICDVGMTPSTVLRSHLKRTGILDVFDHWSFSDEVGWYKPAPEIFAHALTGLGGIAPARCAHIGDLRRTDVAGAKAMGMLALRYSGVFDDDQHDLPEGDQVIADHAELPGLLL